jgi:hypothetical protein
VFIIAQTYVFVATSMVPAGERDNYGAEEAIYPYLGVVG